jgi:sterol 22-desaturase
MVKDPFGFWERQRALSDPGFSFNSLGGKMMVFVTDAAKTREILSIGDADRMLMVLHPSAKNILGKDCFCFVHGPAHKALRKSFMALFTRKALSTYVELQDGLIRSHLEKWLTKFEGEEVEIRPFVRDLNQMTSQEVFIGPYLDDPVVKERFTQGYHDMTEGFLAMPIYFPGTTVWRARKGRDYVMMVLEASVGRARDYIASGGEPRCLIDFWVMRCMEEIAEAKAAGLPPPGHTSDYKMADAVLLFLFASQDASTASLVWTVATMADHPDVLEKVREEQMRLRGADLAKTLDGETLGEMAYTRQVVKELLRWRAPAPMVPQVATANYQLSDDYTVPKGALIFPSINAGNMQGFPDAEKFDPERFSVERKEDILHAKNYLTFGAGPHYCVGKEYAINHMVAFLAILSTTCNWTRRRTEKSDLWQYLPTIYPHDSYITLTRREAA